MKLYSSIMAVAAAVAVASSCTNDNTAAKTIESSSSKPVISIAEGDQIELASATKSCNLHISSDVAVVTGESNSAGLIRANNASDKSENANLIGSSVVSITSTGNKGYTQDASMNLVQSVWADKYIDYTAYGLVETPVYFRVRGEKGTNYVKFFADDKEGAEYYKKETSKPYYIKGELKAISEVSKGSEDIATGKTFANYFKDWGYTPALTKADLEKVVLTIATETGDATIEVAGRSRDNEMTKLLGRIKVGDTIEVPAGLGTWDSISKKKFSTIRTQQVFVI